jgi:hypothetical protein
MRVDHARARTYTYAYTRSRVLHSHPISLVLAQFGAGTVCVYMSTEIQEIEAEREQMQLLEARLSTACTETGGGEEEQGGCLLMDGSRVAALSSSREAEFGNALCKVCVR